jgi:hypothetical protein
VSLYLGNFGANSIAEFANTAGVERFWQKVRKSEGCWLWTGAVSFKGYGRVWAQEGHGARTRKRKAFPAHRVAVFLATGSDPGLLVLHRCDNKRCVRPEHLYVGTNADNMRDASVRLHKRSRKLDYRRAGQIRERVAAGAMQKDVAREFGVTNGTVQQLVARKTYMHDAVFAEARTP